MENLCAASAMCDALPQNYSKRRIFFSLVKAKKIGCFHKQPIFLLLLIHIIHFKRAANAPFSINAKNSASFKNLSL